MDLQLDGKVAIVTGGSKGIGRAIVEQLLAEGASVVGVNRNVDEGRRLEDKLQADGGRCYFIQGDLSDTATCRMTVETTLARFGQLDILVNNAGVNDGVSVADGPTAFRDSLSRNLTHYYAMVHYGLDALRTSRGSIVNVGSKVSITGQGGTSGYAASKGAINGLTREWAVDLAPSGIRVNTVIPAECWTPLYELWLSERPDPQAARRSIEQLIPLGKRFTTPQELADMVVFLASPRSSHTTGQIIFVDGGYTHLDRKATAVGGD